MSETVLTISDSNAIHHLTEGHIDEWWRSLPTARKVALFEADLEAPTLASDTDFRDFDAHAERFLAAMRQLSKSPFADLIKEYGLLAAVKVTSDVIAEVSRAAL